MSHLLKILLHKRSMPKSEQTQVRPHLYPIFTVKIFSEFRKLINICLGSTLQTNADSKKMLPLRCLGLWVNKDI